MKKVFSIANLVIPASAETIQNAVSSLPGIESAEVNLASRILTVSYDPEILSDIDILHTIAKCGYSASVIPDETKTVTDTSPVLSKRLLCTLILFILIFILPRFAYLFLLLTLAINYDLWRIDETKGRLFRTVLVVSASVFFFVFQNPAFASMVGVVLLTRRYIHNKVVQARQTMLASIHSDIPGSAHIYQNHQERQTDTSSLKPDDIVLIRPGETIPVDGTVRNGYGKVDESTLTGWDVLSDKNVGSTVYAGTKLTSGFLEIKAESTGIDTTMMQFLHMAEDSANHSLTSPLQHLQRYSVILILFCAVLAAFGAYYQNRSLDQCLLIALSVLACIDPDASPLASRMALLHTAINAAHSHIYFRHVDTIGKLNNSELLLIDGEDLLYQKDYILTDLIPADQISQSTLNSLLYAMIPNMRSEYVLAISNYLRKQPIQKRDARLSANAKLLHSSFSLLCGTIDEITEHGIEPGQYWRAREDDLYRQGKHVYYYCLNRQVFALAAFAHPVLVKKEELSFLRADDAEAIAVCPLADYETKVLSEKLGITVTSHYPDLSNQDQSVTYLSMHPKQYLINQCACVVLFGTARREADLYLPYPSLKDYQKASAFARKATDSIASTDLFLFIYQVILILLFSILLPMFSIYQPFLAALLCAACSLYAIHCAQ